MTNTLARKPGGIKGRMLIRVAIWVGLAVYAAYLSSVAFAEQTGSAERRYAMPDFSQIPGLSRIDRTKARMFEKPTRANPRAEIGCLALNIYFEARGEPKAGKLGVAHVVMNRVASARFPDTVCGVVRQGGEVRRYRCQFSWWCDGRSDRPRNRREWRISNEIALAVYWGRTQDPTDGAMWYHADYVKPAWRREFKKGPKIGRHIFYSKIESLEGKVHLASWTLKH